jgi:hypothetical protein
MTNKPVPCLIWWNIHDSHTWWYTDEGGGHMMDEQFLDGTETEHWCPGVDYVPTHRGIPQSKWVLSKTHDHKPKRRAK